MAKKKKKKTSKWIDTSAFNDGYDIGDGIRTVVRTVKKSSKQASKQAKIAASNKKKSIKEDTLDFLSSGNSQKVARNIVTGAAGIGVLSELFDSKLGQSVKTAEDNIDSALKTPNKDEKRSYFRRGLFEDGYDFGDVTKTLLGTNKDLADDLGTGAAKIGEGLIDTVAYGVGAAAKGLGNDKFADKTKDFISRDLVGESNLGEKIGQVFPGVAIMGAVSDRVNKGKTEEVSVLGDKSDALVQSAGQLGGTIGLQAVGVPWWLTTGVTGFGSGTEEAFKNDATYGEAGVYGGISAGSEIIFEKLSGGIKFGGRALDDGLKRKLSDAIANKTLSSLAKFGLDAVGEGTEEVLTEITQNIGKKLTFEDEKTWKELLASEEAMDGYIESFIGGAVLGGGMSGAGRIKASKTGRDYDTGLTDHEQSVVNAEVENRATEQQKKSAVESEVNRIIEERQKTVGDLTETEQKNIRKSVESKLDSGELDFTTAKLSAKERTKIEKQVREDLEKGYIGVDSIESTLAKEKTTRIKELQQQLESVAPDKKAEIEAEINQLKLSRATQMKGMLSKDNYLQESYRQELLKGKEFEREVTDKDSDITKELIESAKNSKMNNTRKMHDLFEYTNKIANDSKTKYGFVNNEQLKELGYEAEGASINGLVRVDKDGATKVLINTDSDKAINTIIGHETTHLLEDANEYAALQNIVKEYATTKGDYDGRIKQITELYKGTNANIENEVTADLVGDYLFTDEQFINNLSTKEPNVFQKIYDYIKHAYKMATAGSKEARQLEQVKRSFDKAYKQISKATTQEVKTNSLTEADSNTVSRRIRTDADVEKYLNTATDNSTKKKTIKAWKKGEKVILRSEEEIKEFIDNAVKGEGIKKQAAYGQVNDRLAETVAKIDPDIDIKDFYLELNPSDIKHLYDHTEEDPRYPDNIPLTIEEVENLPNYLDNFTDIIETVNKKGEKNKVKKVLIGTRINGYTVISNIVSDGRYSVRPKTMYKMKTEAYLEKFGDKIKKKKAIIDAQAQRLESGSKEPPSYGTSSINNIPTKEDIVNAEKQSRSLSKAQEEYFKDSKVRDENGNLKVMYHGTSAGGHTVFDPYGKAKYGLFGVGSYFTDNKEVAESYTEKGRGKNKQIYETYLNITNPIDMDAAADPSAWSKALAGANFPAEGTNEDFYRAMEEYFEDQEYSRWEASEAALETLESMGYDGITHIGGGRFNKKDETRHRVYIAFQPEQVKNVDNTNPTADADIRYSLSAKDSEYKSAVERGDTETAQRLVDEAAEQSMKNSAIRNNNGLLLKVYHGTNAKFNSFNDPKHTPHGEAGTFFFSPWKSKSEEYGDNVRAFYLNIERPRLYDEDFNELNPDEEEIDGAIFIPEDIEDGIDPKLQGDTEIVAYYPDQIKSADPITYDDNGNVIPLSKRFNEKDPDIRYSLSDNQGRTLSKQQQERFKDSKVRNENGELLTMYHGTPNGEYEAFKDGTYFTPNKEYADRYQDPSASSISTGKVKSKPETFEVYLDIKKPFDISDPEAREIYINDYIKGGNAMGINPYLPDSEYDKIKNIDWTEGEDLREFLIEEGYDYDGLVLDEGADGGYGDAVEYRGRSYVIFSPEQAKRVDNENPTDDPRMRYSLSESDIAPIRDDYRALNESDIPYVEQQGTEAFNRITDDMAPVEMEEPIYEEDDFEPENPLEADGRDIKDVGKRNVKAYMYENPEVKPFFQAEAAYMLNDLKNSVKGQKHFNDQLYYESSGEQGWYGTKRETSDEIAYLLDEFNYSYADIEKGLNAIIEDHGAENNAISKRIEFMIDERLREGYEDMMYGDTVPPNEEYINLLREKQITEYSDEAYEAWVRSLADVEAPVEPITQGGIDYIRNLSREAGIDTADIVGRYGVGSLEEMSREQYMDAVKWLDEVAIAPVRVPEAPEPPVRETVEDIAPIRDDIPISQGVQQEMREDGTTGDVPEDIPKKTRKELQKELLAEDSDFIIKAMENAKNRNRMTLNNADTIRATELVFGRKAGNKINEAIFQKAIDNEARSIYWQNKQRADIKALGIKAKDWRGRPTKESAAVQKYGEGEYINEFGDLVQYGDGDLMMEFPDESTQERIKEAARIIKIKYEQYIDLANEVFTGLGFDPIPKRKNYMRHFQELTDVFSNNGIPFNPRSMEEHVLPTDINGLTEFWSPQKNYFANLQPRKGKRTTLDAITGIDGYISGIANLIFHTEDIQRGRAFEEMIRENFGEERGYEIADTLPDVEQAKRKELIEQNHLSKYAAWVHEWTNGIAGKKNKADRVVEDLFDRKAFTVLDTLRKQVGANMIGLNLSSSLTNLIAPVQAMAKTNKIAVMKGAIDTFKNIAKNDGFVDKNPFLTSRFGTDMLSKTLWEKATDAGYIFMKGMDHFSSNLIVRSKYNELIKKGMSEKQAHKEAGKFAARIMGDRTKGASAHYFNSKALGVLTQFQLEVNNQLYSMFYDTYHETKEKAQGSAVKAAAGRVFVLGQLFAFTHIFGKGFEAVAGYNPTFDVLGIVATLLGIGGDEEEEKTLGERSEEAALQLLKALPYSSLIVDGGRIPIGQALPISEFISGEDKYGNKINEDHPLLARVETVAKALPYYALPTGYGQIKKTAGGVEMFIGDKPVSGSYTDSGNLRFPVEETPANVVHAAIFGKWANKNAQDYIDNERMPLKEKQIQEYKDLDMPIKDYWEYREGLSEQDTLEDKFDYIAGLDVSVRQKNIMINNAVDREERVDLTNYGDFGSYEEFEFATERPELYSIAKTVGYDDFMVYYNDINDLYADKDQYGNSIRGTKKAKVMAYINSLDIDYGTKLILHKMEYNADDDLNVAIIEYVNSRQDLTYEDRVAILSQVGMQVGVDGRIYW